MICPKCDKKTHVIGTFTEGAVVVRRRKCKTCGNVFYTTEATRPDSHYEFNRLNIENMHNKKHNKKHNKN